MLFRLVLAVSAQSASDRRAGHFMWLPPAGRYRDLRARPNAAVLTEQALRGGNASRRRAALLKFALQSAAPGFARSAALTNVGVAAWRDGESDAQIHFEAALRAEPRNRLARLNLQLMADEQRSGDASAAPWCADDIVAMQSTGAFGSCTAARAAGACEKNNGVGRLRSICRKTCALCGAELAKRLPRGWREGRLDEPLDLGARCDIDVRSVVGRGALTAAEFAERYVRGRRPVLIRGIVEKEAWPAASWAARWTASPHDGGHGEQSPTAERAPLSLAARYTLDTLALCNAEHSNAYINLDRSPHDARVRKELLRAYGDNGALTGVDLLAQSCYADLPSRWLLVSGLGTGSGWHVDPLNTSAWNALISGRKRWAMYPPEVGAPPGVPRDVGTLASGDAAARGQGWWGITAPHRLSLKSREYFSTTLPNLPSSARRPLQCMQRAGDTIFVPSGYWHATLNTAAGNVAFTQNFASAANIDEVAAELAKRPAGTAPRACYDALRRDGHLSARSARASPECASAREGVPPLEYERAEEGVIVGGKARFHLLVFASGADDRDAMLRSAATRAVSDRANEWVVVMVRRVHAKLRALFDVPARGGALRIAELGAICFVYHPPAANASGEGDGEEGEIAPREVARWVADVAAGRASPMLSPSDRRSLFAMYAEQQRAAVNESGRGRARGARA